MTAGPPARRPWSVLELVGLGCLGLVALPIVLVGIWLLINVAVEIGMRIYLR